VPNTAARTVNLPNVKKASAWQPKAATADVASGCQGGRTANPSAAASLAAALVLAMLRRRAEKR
jgi:hypothetical protein